MDHKIIAYTNIIINWILSHSWTILNNIVLSSSEAYLYDDKSQTDHLCFNLKYEINITYASINNNRYELFHNPYNSISILISWLLQ